MEVKAQACASRLLFRLPQVMEESDIGFASTDKIHLARIELATFSVLG